MCSFGPIVPPVFFLNRTLNIELNNVGFINILLGTWDSNQARDEYFRDIQQSCLPPKRSGEGGWPNKGVVGECKCAWEGEACAEAEAEACSRTGTRTGHISRVGGGGIEIINLFRTGSVRRA